MKNKAVFLDRDGVVIKMHYNLESGTIDTPFSIKQVLFVPGIFEFLQYAKKLGYLLILISNQPGVGIKKISLKRQHEINNYIMQALQKQGVTIDGQFYCMHHPYASIKKYKKECDCRKPKTGLFLQASREFDINLEKSWMIGDGVHDILAGYSAGCKTILIANLLESEYLRIIEDQLEDIKPTFLVKNIKDIEILFNTHIKVVNK